MVFYCVYIIWKNTIYIIQYFDGIKFWLQCMYLHMCVSWKLGSSSTWELLICKVTGILPALEVHPDFHWILADLCWDQSVFWQRFPFATTTAAEIPGKILTGDPALQPSRSMGICPRVIWRPSFPALKKHRHLPEIDLLACQIYHHRRRSDGWFKFTLSVDETNNAMILWVVTCLRVKRSFWRKIF